MMHLDMAAKCTTVLVRLMPNISESSDAKRRLLNSAVSAEMMYAAPVWADAVNIKGLARKLEAVQRISTLRIVSAYRTVFGDAILVLVSILPVDLLAQERKEIYEKIKKGTKDLK